MKSHKKRRFNSKKGISLVVAIALATVLFLTTTSFISIALLQQKETGSELNTRQAYVSAKSALDLAQEMIESGDIIVPSGTGSAYYVLYYDSTGVLTATSDLGSAAAAENFIKTTTYTVVGNSFIKITNDGTGSCTVSSFSSEGKYTSDPDDVSQGDLSMEFTATDTLAANTTNTNLRIDIGDYSTPSNPSGTPFLLVGGQTNFSLLKSAYPEIYNSSRDFQTMKQYSLSSDGTNSQVLFLPWLETPTLPVKTQFPLVFTETVQLDSNSNRCTYEVYNNGVYFLGNYTPSKTNMESDYKSPRPSNVSYFTTNNRFGAELHCKFVVIENNMVARVSAEDNYVGMKVSYYGEGNSNYVVVYLPNGSTFTTYNDEGYKKSSKSYAAGYYLLSSGNDLFTYTLQAISDPANDSRCQAIAETNIYSSLKNTDGTFKELHAAWEEKTDVSTGSKPVSILDRSGKFTTSTSGDTYSTSGRSYFYNGWYDYSIYCGPSEMPSTQGYYDMYCGDTFNYLWYNVNEMNVKNGVKMSIRSNEAVITIGGDSTEQAIETQTSSNKILRNYFPGETYPSSETKVSGPYTASNKIVGNGNAEFWIRPYWNETSYSISVMNDFEVSYPGGSYTVKKGSYKTELPSNGINLLSSAGQSYFESHSPEEVDSTDSTIGWVDSTGTIVNTTSPSNQSGNYVNFKATSGKLQSATYEASVIECDFSGFIDPVETTGNTKLKANIVSLKGDIKGEHLYIDTSSGKSQNKCTDSGTNIEGLALVIEDDLALYDKNGEKIVDLNQGYYFFPTTSYYVDILDKSTWTNTHYFTTDKNTDIVGQKIKYDTVVNIQFDQGRYY